MLLLFPVNYLGNTASSIEVSWVVDLLTKSTPRILLVARLLTLAVGSLSSSTSTQEPNNREQSSEGRKMSPVQSKT